MEGFNDFIFVLQLLTQPMSTQKSTVRVKVKVRVRVRVRVKVDR